MLTLQSIATMQQLHKGEISVNYLWEPSSNVPVATIRRVWITFLKPNAPMWKYIMTEPTDGFELRVSGTRHQIHDGLDECYAAVLYEVNTERAKIGLDRVNR